MITDFDQKSKPKEKSQSQLDPIKEYEALLQETRQDLENERRLKEEALETASALRAELTSNQSRDQEIARLKTELDNVKEKMAVIKKVAEATRLREVSSKSAKLLAELKENMQHQTSVECTSKGLLICKFI